jgi:hypothetical protein
MPGLFTPPPDPTWRNRYFERGRRPSRKTMVPVPRRGERTVSRTPRRSAASSKRSTAFFLSARAMPAGRCLGVLGSRSSRNRTLANLDGHAPGMPVHYDLHVWLGRTNPDGLFAVPNPSISCPGLPG